MSEGPTSTSRAITKRDFADERMTYQNIADVPLNTMYGLNTFEFFQGMHELFRGTAEGIIRMFPGGRYFRNRDYIADTLIYTRFRNIEDGVL